MNICKKPLSVPRDKTERGFVSSACVRSGMANAKAKGAKIGRPQARNVMSLRIILYIKQLSVINRYFVIPDDKKHIVTLSVAPIEHISS